MPDFLDRLGAFVVALDALLERTGPNCPPGFAAALASASGEDWADREVVRIWEAMLITLHTYYRLPLAAIEIGRMDKVVGAPVTGKIDGPVSRSRIILDDIRLRWRLNFINGCGWDDFFIKGGLCVLWGERDGKGRKFGPCMEVPAPILEPAEHEALAWTRDALARVGGHFAETVAPILCFKATLLKALDRSEGYTDYLENLRAEGTLEFEDPPKGPKGKPLIIPIAFRFTDPEEHRRVRQRVKDEGQGGNN